jgi:hypothetical protein
VIGTRTAESAGDAFAAALAIATLGGTGIACFTIERRHPNGRLQRPLRRRARHRNAFDDAERQGDAGERFLVAHGLRQRDAVDVTEFEERRINLIL